MRNKFRPCCLLLTISVYLCFVSACGKIGDPLPPIPRAPLIVSEPVAIQQGNKIILSIPVNRTSRTVLPRRIDVYRLIETTNDPEGLTEETFSSRAALVTSIPGSDIRIGMATLNYEDEIDFKSSIKKPRYRYSTRIVDAEDRTGDFSTYALVTPLIEIAAPPSGLKASVTQSEITLSWQAPTENLSGNKPASVAGYHLYRQSGAALVRLNPRPLTEPQFTDRQFQFGIEYQYVVRALSLPEGSKNINEALETNPSSVLTVTPKDTFAPAAPDSITIASVNSIVSLFWPANSEADIAGYNIYRAEAETTPPENWIRLNPRLHSPTTFRDDKVKTGTQYFYQITAVDIYGNESQRSVVLSEIVNP